MRVNATGMGNRVLGLTMQVTSVHGWGIHALYLAKRLLETKTALPVQIAVPAPEVNLTSAERKLLAPFFLETNKVRSAFGERKHGHFPYPAFHSLGNHPAYQMRTATIVPGPLDTTCIVFEDPDFDSDDLAILRQFKRVMTVSSWNQEVLGHYGIDAECCNLGVDADLFAPAPRGDRFGDWFVVFSGGKAEFRKGQDIVLAAFKDFHRRHPDSLLVTAWHNPWPSTVTTLKISPHGTGAPMVAADGTVRVDKWAKDYGLPAGSFVDIGPVSNRAMAQILRSVDVAVFPNRCEGGTNMIAMECLAAGVPTILSANSGHLDLAEIPHLSLTQQKPISIMHGYAGESSVDEIVEHLELLYAKPDVRLDYGTRAAEVMQKDWRWSTRLDRQIGVIGQAAGWALEPATL